MSPRRELLVFAVALGALLLAFFGESLFGGKVLSPADVLFVSASFADRGGPLYEPSNRLLIDPVLQFQPWLEFNRAMLRRGRLPLWNSRSGCGAPHLANGQSAVFDPFHAIAYLGTLPEAHAWMAAARLWIAGLGMFVLARSWGLGLWGRWFAGLAFPFCGFLIVWLLYPVTSAAVWMPWLLWASDRTLDHRDPKSLGLLALFTGFTLLGGHVQTSAHVLLAAGLYALWRSWQGLGRGGLIAWSLGIGLGIALAAIEIVPLGFYLAKSPVWTDRARERTSPWVLARPRWLNAVATAFPYAFGSQRRGHPNLARAVGANNLNESAGGFAGLATLVWLAPLAWRARTRQPRVRFLTALVAVGAMGAFALPPVDNLLRALPVLNVTDNRRLTLWIAFGLVMLGGLGLDELASWSGRRHGRAWVGLWVVAALGMLASAALVGRFGGEIQHRARTHYAQSATATPGADPIVYRARADRQVRLALAFLPRYLILNAGQLIALAVLAEWLRRGTLALPLARGAVSMMVLLDLLGFGWGLNPAIAREDDRPVSPVITALQREVGPLGRVLSLGEELPPNTLMRYGLKDIRNYDSIELSRSLDWFAPLYEPSRKGRSSRREVAWSGVIRAADRLREASVLAVVSPSPPPRSFDRVDRVGAVWVAWLEGRPLVSTQVCEVPSLARGRDGWIQINLSCRYEDRIIVRETYDPGWRAELDGKAVAVEPYQSTFLAVPIASGARELTLRYDPIEVRAALGVSIVALVLTVFVLTAFRPVRSTRILIQGLGRTRAVELESNLRSSPDFLTGSSLD